MWTDGRPSPGGREGVKPKKKLRRPGAPDVSHEAHDEFKVNGASPEQVDVENG